MRIVGLDLGQSIDPAAAAVVDRTSAKRIAKREKGWSLWNPDTEKWEDVGGKREHESFDAVARALHEVGEYPLKPATLRCVSLKQWPLKTDYCDVVRDVCGIRWDVLAVDFCGVGRPVVDFLNREKLETEHAGRVMPIATAASSARVHQHEDYVSVPKIDLVASIRLAKSEHGLVLPSGDATNALLAQLDDFQMRYGKQSVSFGNVEKAGKHDDLVSALGLACWVATTYKSRRPAIYVG